MRDLTARQQEILDLIRQHIADTGFPPTRAEIELTSGASRGIRLKMIPDAQRADLTSAVQIALSLPLVGRVAAGSPILAQEHVEASYALDPSLFEQRPDYLLKVRGMSMRDAVHRSRSSAVSRSRCRPRQTAGIICWRKRN